MDMTITKEERVWAMLCHLSAFAFFVFPFGNILGPLIMWLIKRDESQFINEQGREALNFQISVSLYALGATLLCLILIGIPILIALFFFDFILVIVAAVRANDGIHYKYPLTLELVK